VAKINRMMAENFPAPDANKGKEDDKKEEGADIK
jgi:hypothetical protein